VFVRVVFRAEVLLLLHWRTLFKVWQLQRLQSVHWWRRRRRRWWFTQQHPVVKYVLSCTSFPLFHSFTLPCFYSSIFHSCTLPNFPFTLPLQHSSVAFRSFGVIRQLPLLWEEFRLPKLTVHSNLRRRAASCRALRRTSSCYYWVAVWLCLRICVSCLSSLVFLNPETGPQTLPTYVVLLVVVLVVSPKAFSFRNRSLLNFAHRLMTISSTIAPCRILKLSPN